MRAVFAQHRRGLHIGGVGADFGLAQAEGGELFAGGQVGEILFLLLVVAHEHQSLEADGLVGADEHSG